MFKKVFILFTSLLVNYSLFAQKVEYNYYYDWEYVKAIYEPIQYFPLKNVEEIHFTSTKSGKKKEFVKRYTKDGKLSYYGSIEEGKEVPIYEFDYNEHGQAINSRSYKNGKLKHIVKETYEVDGGGRTSLEKFDAKGKLILKNTWEYKSEDCLSKSIRYKGNGKLHRKWVYTYYDACDKERTELYNGKDKLLKTWSFNCKEEGELVAKKKDTVQTCRWEESDGEHLLKVYQTLDEKGKVRKHVSKFTLADTLILERSTYDEENNLLSTTLYDKSYRKILSHTNFRKGEKRYETKYEYEGDYLIKYEHLIKGKFYSSASYEYKDSLLVSYKQVGKNGKEISMELDYPKE